MDNVCSVYYFIGLEYQMFMMISKEGSSLPVVHIRVLYEQENKIYSCDYCFQTYLSEKSLSNHICTKHISVEVQDVFVCSICNCCLLSQSDLVEHTSLRHQLQLQEELDTSYKLCEYCGVQFSNYKMLCDHMKTDHAEISYKVEYIPSITELTLAEISSIGIASDRCKTLFKVVEIPWKKNETSYFKENKHLDKGNEVLNLLKDRIHQKYSKSKGPLNEDIIIEMDVKKNVSLEYECKKQEFLNELSSWSESNKHERSKSFVNVHGESEGLVFPVVKGKPVLSVDHEEKLLWRKEVISEVVPSCLLSNSSVSDINPSVIVENVCQDLCDIDHPNLVPITVSSEEEVGTQIFGGNSENGVTNNHAKLFSVESNSKVKTHVVVGCVNGRNSCTEEENGTKGQVTLRKRRDCCICGKIFSNMGELEKHERSVHGVRIKCDLCSDTFAFSKSLRTHHLRKHSNSKSFPCEFCGRVFKSRGNLWSHRLSHNLNAKRHQCPQCPQRFHSKSKLNNHLHCHSGKKKYQCGECNKGFLYPGLLVHHMGKHFSAERWDVPENETFYLVEVETEDADIVATPSEKRLK